MSDNGSIYIPPPDEEVQLAQRQTPPMQTRQQAAISNNDLVIPPTQLSNNTNSSNSNNGNNNDNKEEQDVPVIPSNPRARRRIIKRNVKRGKRNMSSDSSNDERTGNNIKDGSTSSESEMEDMDIKPKKKKDKKKKDRSSDDTSNSGKNLVTSFSAQLNEVRNKYPDFEINRLFEKFIFNRYSRAEVRAKQAEYKRTKRSFTLKDYDEYLAVRVAMEDILSEEQASYFYELELNKQVNVYRELREKLDDAQEKLEEYAMEENPQHKQRVRLIKDYDRLRKMVLEKAKEKPGNGDLSLARRWEKKSPSELKVAIRGGYTLWMDLRGGRIPKPSHNNNNNKNYYSEDSDNGQLPKLRGKRKLKQKPKEKKSQEELLEDIRGRFTEGKNLTVAQRSYLLDKLSIIDKNIKEFSGKMGHKQAQDEKEELEDTESEDEDQPPKKKRKLDNMDRMDEAERKSKEEVK